MDWERLAARTAVCAFAIWLTVEAGAGIESRESLLDRAIIGVATAGSFAVLYGIRLAYWYAEGVFATLLNLLAVVLSVPIALLVAERLQAGGAPGLSISGLGGLLLSSAVIWVVLARGVLTAALAVLAMSALWLVQELLGGAHQSGGGWLATLAVLGVLCSVGGGNLLYWDGPGLPAMWVPVVVPFTLTGLRLLVVTWLSTFMAAPLRFDGVWWFVLAVVILTVVTAPAWIAEQVWRRRRLQEQAWQEAQAMRMHHDAVMGMTMMSVQSALFWTDRARHHRGY